MASLSVCKPMPPNEPLVNAIQLKRAVKNDKENQSCKDDEMDRIINDLKFDLNRPLKHFLQSVFKKGGRVVLAFPGSSYAQVKEVADDIREEVADDIKQEVEPTWMLSGFSWIWSWIFPYASNQRLPKIDVEVVQTITTPVEEYMCIIREEIQNCIKKDPSIDLVKLVSSETENEALTVDLQHGNVYFKQFANDSMLDDTSIFFRVEYESIRDFLESSISNRECNDPGLVIILINLKTLLPIGRNENDELIALIPEIHTSQPLARLYDIDIPDNIAHPFQWLPKILQEQSDHSIYLYYQRGTDESSVIYPATEPEAVRRVSKGDNDAAVIRDSDMEFVVHPVKIHGRTN